jgi:hypothetical protein
MSRDHLRDRPADGRGEHSGHQFENRSSGLRRLGASAGRQLRQTQRRQYLAKKIGEKMRNDEKMFPKRQESER